MERLLYHHQQAGHGAIGRRVHFIVAAGILVIIVGFATTAPLGAGVTLGVASAVALAAAVMLAVGVSRTFGTLTVEIGQGELRHYFGKGIFPQRYPLANIVSVSAATSSAWEGWGLRLTGRGMLYNVAGKDAVEVKLRSGKRFRIGTDEPAALVAALERAMVAGSVEVSPSVRGI